MTVTQETPDDGTGAAAADLPAAINVASLPWAFTQRQPLSASQLISEAKRRGYDLDPSALRELYRLHLLIPFVYVNSRRVGPVPEPVGVEPQRGGTLLYELRYARDRGRLSDPAVSPFRPRLRFDDRGVGDPERWWNRLIYSHYQLLALPAVQDLLARRTNQMRGSRRWTRLSSPSLFLHDHTTRLRNVALALAGLEARYLPKLDAEWIQLVNADQAEWQACRNFGAFDYIQSIEI